MTLGLGENFTDRSDKYRGLDDFLNQRLERES